MKILFLTLANINSIDDRAIYPDLLRKFRDEGHNIVILSPLERKYKKKTELISEFSCCILKVWTTNIQKTNILEKIISTLIIEFLYLRAINKYFREDKFDLILYSTPPITFTRLITNIKMRTNAKTYLLLKDIFPQNAVDLKMINKSSIAYKYFRHKEQKLYEISDYIGCMSQANKSYILKNNYGLNIDKIEVNPNSVYLDSKLPNHSVTKTEVVKFSFPEEKTIFVYGGNLGKPQGINFLLQIINYSQNNSKAFFVIIGSGTEFSFIYQWFNKFKPKNAILLTELPHSEYQMLLKKCHVGLVFLHPDFTIPNYPSRILTYMENKLPILFGVDKNTDVGRDAELGEYGFSCENGDLEAFIKYVDLLCNNIPLRERMGKNGYNRLLKDFNVNYSYKLIMNHFKK